MLSFVSKEPKVVGILFIGVKSLMAKGSPNNFPSKSFLEILSSQFLADSKAFFLFTYRKEFNSASYFSILSKYAFVNSYDEICLVCNSLI